MQHRYLFSSCEQLLQLSASRPVVDMINTAHLCTPPYLGWHTESSLVEPGVALEETSQCLCGIEIKFV